MCDRLNYIPLRPPWHASAWVRVWERKREIYIRKMIEGSCNAFEFEYHIVQSFLTPARKWETLQRGSSKPILNPIESAEQKDLSEANFNLPEDIFFHQQVWQVSNKNMRKLWKAYRWKGSIRFKTFFKRCPGRGANLGSLDFCIFSLTIAAP